jgi:hypothetical protein
MISASLLQRCIIGDGNFLDIKSCSTHDMESSSRSLLAKRRRGSMDSERKDRSTALTQLTSVRTSASSVRASKTNLDNRLGEEEGERRGGGGREEGGEGSRSEENLQNIPKIHKIKKKDINMLFCIRNFLESLPESEEANVLPYLAEIANFSMGASLRVLKLLSASMFHSCLPGHMKVRVRVRVRYDKELNLKALNLIQP